MRSRGRLVAYVNGVPKTQPFLRDVPLWGGLFRQQTRPESSVELIIVVTPRILAAVPAVGAEDALAAGEPGAGAVQFANEFSHRGRAEHGKRDAEWDGQPLPVLKLAMHGLAGHDARRSTVFGSSLVSSCARVASRLGWGTGSATSAARGRPPRPPRPVSVQARPPRGHGPSRRGRTPRLAMRRGTPRQAAVAGIGGARMRSTAA